MTRRTEVATLAGTLISFRRIVPVVALPRPAPAIVAAALVRATAGLICGRMSKIRAQTLRMRINHPGPGPDCSPSEETHPAPADSVAVG